MKKIWTLFAGLCLLTSCESFDTMNVDPNKATTTHPKLLLAGICRNAFSDASVGPAHACRMQVKNDQESAEQTYKWTRGSFGDYSRLRDVQKMDEAARGLNNTTYIALAEFFKACYFYDLTMTFGDIPYSQALKGESEQIFQPAYDSQEIVFAGILRNLSTADSLLAGDESVIDGDIIYNGNPAKWRKLINSFRLKVLMSLSRRNRVNGLDIATEFAFVVSNKPLMEGVGDNAQIVYLDKTGNRYPQNNSTTQSTEAYADSTFVSRLQDREDPRLFTFYTPTKNAREAGKAINDFTAYEGGDPITTADRINAKVGQGTISKLNERFYLDAVNEPSVWLGYAEVQQILAEAVVRGWIGGNARQYYENGVRASFKFYETYVSKYAEYLGENAVQNYLLNPLVDFTQAVTMSDKLERIIMQKYLASFYQGAWTPYFEQLRTGYPGFRTTPGTMLPKRWMYPLAEYNNNAAHVEKAIAAQFGSGNDKTGMATWQNK